MSFLTSVFSRLRCASGPRAYSTAVDGAFSSAARTRTPTTSALAPLRNAATRKACTRSTVALGLGLGLYGMSRPYAYCDPLGTSSRGATPPPLSDETLPPPLDDTPSPDGPPKSSISYLELSFGTVTGICAGVFIKKGAKMVAFVLGGVFVLLQYLGQSSIVRVDWGRMNQRFEKLFYTTDKTGKRHPPTVSSAWNWLVNFLTADFQPRASFLAGLLLGLRIG